MCRCTATILLDCRLTIFYLKVPGYINNYTFKVLHVPHNIAI